MWSTENQWFSSRSNIAYIHQNLNAFSCTHTGTGCISGIVVCLCPPAKERVACCGCCNLWPWSFDTRETFSSLWCCHLLTTSHVQNVNFARVKKNLGFWYIVVTKVSSRHFSVKRIHKFITQNIGLNSFSLHKLIFIDLETMWLLL